jgi:DNA-directed RNA polymerase subunit RPC12/RpoP
MMNSSQKNISSTIKCAICHRDIKSLFDVYQDTKTKGIVCTSCKKRFADEDFELIIYLLFIYGGYFGMLKKKDFSLAKMLEEFNISFISNSIDIEEVNRKFMHKALLHGYTPKEYKKHLNSLLFGDDL